MKIDSIRSLIGYSFRNFPLAYTALILSLVSVAIEFAALAALFPLAETAAGREISPASHWVKILTFANLRPTFQLMIGVFLTLLLIRALTLFLSNAVISLLSRRLIAGFSSQAFETFVRSLTFTEINTRNIGYFIGLAGDEAYRAANIVTSLVRLCPTVALTLIYFGAIAYQSMAVAATILIFMFAYGLAFGIAMRRTHRLGALMTEQSRVLGSHFLDALNSLRSVRALAAEEFVSQRYRELLKIYAKTGVAVDYTNLIARYGPVWILILGGLALVGLAQGGASYVENASFLVVILLLLMRFFPSLGQVVDVSLKLIADLKSGQDISYVLERGEKQYSRQINKNLSQDLGPIRCVSLCEVSFSYDSGKPILTNLNLEFVAGLSYALVSPSGTGKSTLVDLLLRFYEPNTGFVKMNGINVVEIDVEKIRSKIVVSEQQARVFNDTIFNNIAFGRDATIDDVRRACQLASIDDDILKMKDGYDTLIGYQGSNISGGQRQRIVLARGLLKKSDVLILDEVTNGLDEGTKSRVIQNLLNEYRNQLLIFVTHDPFVVERVDRVIDISDQSQLSDSQTEIVANQS